jgi:4-azaleucine resistance transporter AzlC
MSRPASSSDMSIVRVTLPVAMGYLPLGFAFGLLFSQLGVHWLWATAMSVAVYAGSAQFLIVSLLASHTDHLTIFLSVILLNLRHVFYGLAMADDFRILNGLRLAISIFLLTDETFAVLSNGTNITRDKRTILIVSLLNYVYWVAACTFGAWFASELPSFPAGLQFALSALFAVILVEACLRDIPLCVIVIAAISALTAAILVPSNLFIFIATMLGAIILVMHRGCQHDG